MYKYKKHICMLTILLMLVTFALPISGADELDNAEEQQNTVFWVQTIGGVGIAAVIIILLIKNRDNITKNSKKNTDVNIDEDKVVDQIRQTDPDFNREQFRDYASKVLLAVLGAISGRNALSARPYESDNLFSVHEKQIREDIEGQRINHMEDITVIFVKIADYIAKDETDTVTVLAKISLLDYTTDTVKGNLLDGSRLAHRNRSFRLEFIRSHGLKSSADLEADTDCPVCNKPMNITVTGKCGECKTNLCDGSRGWILNSLSKWGRET